MICALVNKRTKLVENLIMASPRDPAPKGYLILGNLPSFVTMGTEWNGVEFVDPSKKSGGDLF